MSLSPKIFYALAAIPFTLTALVLIFDHSSFWAGVTAGVGGATTLLLIGVGYLRGKLEAQMENAQAQLGEMMGVDVEKLLGGLSEQ